MPVFRLPMEQFVLNCPWSHLLDWISWSFLQSLNQNKRKCLRYFTEKTKKRLPKQVIFNLMKICKLFQNLNLLSIFRSNLPIAFQAREHQRNTFEYLKCKPSGEAARRIFPFWCHSQYWTGDIGSPNADYEPPTRQDGPSVKREIVIQSNSTRNKFFDMV